MKFRERMRFRWLLLKYCWAMGTMNFDHASELADKLSAMESKHDAE